MKRRVGRFYFPAPALLTASEELLQEYAYILALLDFMPFNVTRLKGDFRFTGYSLQFKEITDGDYIPEYDIVVFRDEAGVVGKVEARPRQRWPAGDPEAEAANDGDDAGG